MVTMVTVVVVAVGGLVAILAAGTPSVGAASQAAGPRVVPASSVVPSSGAYLGIFYAPGGDVSPRSEVASVASTLDPLLGRNPAIVSLYQGFGPYVIPNDVLNQVVYSQHALPLISWSCGNVPDSDINAGIYDHQIALYAEQLKTFGSPVLLRWFWEMNLQPSVPGTVNRNTTCLGQGLSPAQQAVQYQLAYQHIWTIFHQVGATNVGFVWSVSSSRYNTPLNAASFYPGNQYVDWIAADGYDRPSDFQGPGAFAYQFSAWYNEFVSYGKPLMVSETASPTSYLGQTVQPPQPPKTEQQAFLTGIEQSLPTQFPAVKALVYFDAPTDLANWQLGDLGMAALTHLASDPYFSNMPGISTPSIVCPSVQNQLLVGQPTAITSSSDGVCPGYAVTSAQGQLTAFGSAAHYSGVGAQQLAMPIVSMAATPDNGGYWLIGGDGGVFAFGDAGFFGSTGAMHLNRPVVAMAPTPDGGGYWLVASDGGIFAFGDAAFLGSTGAMHLNQPVVAMAPTPDGGGYWLVASDGGIFAFGDAAFLGSTGAMHLNQPVVGISADPAGRGYALVASDGGVFDFGAPFYGSLGNVQLSAPITSLTSSDDGNGYLLLGKDGGIFTFGDAAFLGRVIPLP
jgi:hypothetical protein